MDSHELHWHSPTYSSFWYASKNEDVWSYDIFVVALKMQYLFLIPCLRQKESMQWWCCGYVCMWYLLINASQLVIWSYMARNLKASWLSGFTYMTILFYFLLTSEIPDIFRQISTTQSCKVGCNPAAGILLLGKGFLLTSKWNDTSEYLILYWPSSVHNCKLDYIMIGFKCYAITMLITTM